MTTNNPEVVSWGSFYEGVMQDFGYNEEATKAAAKLDFHGRTLSIEPLIRLSDYEALQAECESLRKDAEIGRSVREKAYPGASYGCHCDLEEGMQPDGCVIDSNEHLLCNYATHIEVKEQCKYWKIIATDTDTLEKSK